MANISSSTSVKGPFRGAVNGLLLMSGSLSNCVCVCVCVCACMCVCVCVCVYVCACV